MHHKCFSHILWSIYLRRSMGIIIYTRQLFVLFYLSSCCWFLEDQKWLDKQIKRMRNQPFIRGHIGSCLGRQVVKGAPQKIFFNAINKYYDTRIVSSSSCWVAHWTGVPLYFATSANCVSPSKLIFKIDSFWTLDISLGQLSISLSVYFSINLILLYGVESSRFLDSKCLLFHVIVLERTIMARLTAELDCKQILYVQIHILIWK